MSSNNCRSTMSRYNRTVDQYVSGGVVRRSGHPQREPKLFSHRFHFTDPSTLTISLTHKDDDVVMYMRRQGDRYMNLTESEYWDIMNSSPLINDKIKQCKLVVGGKIPPMVDVGRQSSTFPKSKETRKLEKCTTRLLLAKRKAMEMLENGDSSSEDDDDDDNKTVSKKKAKVAHQKKTNKNLEQTHAEGSEEDESDA